MLVIDDDPLFRSLLVTVLRRDYLVSVATEGADGFRKAIEHPPDLAVIDLQMAGWDGLQTLKAIRSDAALTRVRTVILTSDASRETVLAAIRAGADDYIIKTSFSREEFLQKIERLVPRLDAVSALASEKAWRRHAPAEPNFHGPSSAAWNSGSSADDATAIPVGAAATAAPDAALSTHLQELIDNWE